MSQYPSREVKILLFRNTVDFVGVPCNGTVPGYLYLYLGKGGNIYTVEGKIAGVVSTPIEFDVRASHSR